MTIIRQRDMELFNPCQVGKQDAERGPQMAKVYREHFELIVAHADRYRRTHLHHNRCLAP